MTKVEIILFITSLITFAVSLLGWMVVMKEITILSNSIITEFDNTHNVIRRESNSLEGLGFDILNNQNELYNKLKLNERGKKVCNKKNKLKSRKMKTKKTLKSKRAKQK